MKAYAAALALLATSWPAKAMERGVGAPPPSSPGPGGPEAATPLASRLAAAQVLLERGFLDAAVAELLPAVKGTPESASALELFARTTLRMENWSATIDTLRRLVRLRPEEVRLHRLLAAITRAYNMPLIEEEALEAIVRLEPGDKASWARIAQLRLNVIPDQDKGLAAWRTLTTLAPDDPAAWRGMARSLGSGIDPEARRWNWRRPSTWLSFDPAGRRRARDLVTARAALSRLAPEGLAERVALAEAYGGAERHVERAAVLGGLSAGRPGDAALRGLLADAQGDLAEQAQTQGLHAAAERAIRAAHAAEPDSTEWPWRARELRRALGPEGSFSVDAGREGGVDFDREKAGIDVPLRKSETRLFAEGARRRAKDAAASASTHLARLGVRRHIAGAVFLEASGGVHQSGGIYRVEAVRRGPAFEASLRRERDFLAENAGALAAGVASSANSFEAASRHLKRLTLRGAMAFAELGASNWREQYSLGAEAGVFEQRPFGHRAALLARVEHTRSGGPTGGLFFAEPRYRVRFLGGLWRWEAPRLAASLELLQSEDSGGVRGQTVALAGEARLGPFDIEAGYALGRSAGGALAAAGTPRARDRRLSFEARMRW